MKPDTPRFRIGQCVVVHSLYYNTAVNGYVGHITDRRMVNFEYSITLGRYQGWGYLLEGLNRLVPERCLRPYDPLGDWSNLEGIWHPRPTRIREGA